MEQITNSKTIYAKWIVEGLLKIGYRPIEIIPNPFKPEFMCWKFEDTEQFEKDLTKILESKGALN